MRKQWLTTQRIDHICVVAWAVSADSAFRSPVVSSLRRTDTNVEPHDEDIFQILEDRHDLSYTRHPGSYTEEDRDYPRVDRRQNVHQNNFDDNPEKDPLYIVHFVPSPKPKAEVSTPRPDAASTVSSEVLQKILSASKGAKPGTPQFVVFAPVPSEEENKGNGNDLTGLGASGLNFLSRPPTPNAELDYDYEEELRKYQELLNSKDDANQKDSSRLGSTTEDSKYQNKIQKESFQVVTKNYSSGNMFQNVQQSQQPRSAGSNIGLHLNEFSPKPIQRQSQPQKVSQTYSQSPQPVLPEATQSNYPQQNYNQQQSNQNFNQADNYPQQSYNQQQSNQNYNQADNNQTPLESSFNQFTQNYNQVQSNYQQPQRQLSDYQQQNSYQGQQPAAVDRSGQYEPLGISLSLGGGHGQGHGHGAKGLLGGGYSPLGIISSILSPVIKKPRVNLNGKLMFGVMLEKGVKFGDDKGHQHGYGKK
ncbi:hypothetical protein AVEN_215712-1 [Araneus ventricosus]|uniref:Uncharacterized protein n=1 Tax=Araneus ventricosus TaxID=182803 RepID=A0A4Y2NA57_ARAVE|nr:hypothetical protein AVEN_215712-1 [Araneus ventricosus]